MTIFCFDIFVVLKILFCDNKLNRKALQTVNRWTLKHDHEAIKSVKEDKRCCIQQNCSQNYTCNYVISLLFLFTASYHWPTKEMCNNKSVCFSRMITVAEPLEYRSFRFSSFKHPAEHYHNYQSRS